MGFVFDSLSS